MQTIFAECIHIFPGGTHIFHTHTHSGTGCSKAGYFFTPPCGVCKACPICKRKVCGGRKGIYPASGYGCGPFSAWDAYTPFEVVFKGPVSRLEKDRNWTRPRPEKTGPAVRSFHFWDLKTAKRPVFMDRFYRLRLVFCSPVFTLQNAPKNIIFGPKIKKI